MQEISNTAADAVIDVEAASLVFQTVEALRRQILAVAGEENPFLGTEHQLIESLGVSRPTFRQAARLLQNEQLLDIRRGTQGGCYARAPSPSAVSRLASIYLHFQRTTLLDIGDAMMPLMLQAAQLAALNPDAHARNRLADLVRTASQADPGGDERYYLRARMAFETLLAEISDNALLALMMRLGFDLARHPRVGTFTLNREQALFYQDYHLKLAEAVRDGNPVLAAAIVKEHLQEIRGWLKRASSSSA